MKNKLKDKLIKSPIKRKILLLLLGGIVLGLAGNPRAQKRVFKSMMREWKNIDRQYLYRTVKEFYTERLVDYQENDDGSVKIVLTEKGKKKALLYKVDEIEIKKPASWDKKWRVVFFDVPEKLRWARDAIRDKLKNLGFYELQKSVFIHPFSCKDEIDFLVEYFQLRRYVRMGELTKLTNEEELKILFKL